MAIFADGVKQHLFLNHFKWKYLPYEKIGIYSGLKLKTKKFRINKIITNCYFIFMENHNQMDD